MTIKITPGSIVSDGHVVMGLEGVSGEVTTEDGTVYNLGGLAQQAIEVDSHEHALEVALKASDLKDADPELPVSHDRKVSEKNFKNAKGA